MEVLVDMSKPISLNTDQAIVVTFGNFKGGTGKTTNSTMLAYTLAKQGYKVLLCDQDPQANATTLYLKTKAAREDNYITFEKTLMAAMQEGDLKDIVTEIVDNLYLLPSFSDFAQYPKFLEKRFESDLDRVMYLSTLLEPLKSEFDFIFIDVPPTISIYTDSALYASDYVVVVLQTQERSLQGAEVFRGYLQDLLDDYDADFDILGILPVLLKNGAAVDLATLENAKDAFGAHNLFESVIRNMERLKRYDITGILEEDMHDKRVMAVYDTVAQEFLLRLQREIEQSEDEAHV